MSWGFRKERSENEKIVPVNTPSLYLSREEEYMLFRIAEQEKTSARDMLGRLIYNEYIARFHWKETTEVCHGGEK